MASHALIIFSYNQAAFVSQCVNSILAMTKRPDRLIWFDDGSTDETATIAYEALGHLPWVEINKNEKNLGLYPNLNQAFRDWGCDFVHFLACDDWFEGDYFISLDTFIRQHSLELKEKFIIVTNHYSVAGSRKKSTDYKGEFLNLSGCIRGLFTTRNLAISASLFSDLNFYNTQIGIWADRLFEAQLVFKAEKIYQLKDAFHCYRVGVGISNRVGRKTQLRSLILVNSDLLSSRILNLRDADRLFLAYCIARDTFEIQRTPKNFIKFVVQLCINMRNGASLRDLKCLIPSIFHGAIKNLISRKT